MRRALSSIAVALGLVGASVGLLGGTASAAPAPGPSGAGGQASAPGKKVCTVSDSRLVELSGLIATAHGYIVINDSTDSPDRKPVFFLSDKCNVRDQVSFPTSPLDPEDLAISPDGKTLWIADIGDNATNSSRRTRVALWSMPIDGSKKPVIHRLSYPDGPHDAEALLIGGDGTPIIITKTGGPAVLYSPAAAMKQNNDVAVPLKKVGQVTLPKTATDNPFGAVGRLMVTGAASGPDGKRVVLRTYGDAFEYEVTDGDVVKALTTGTPRITALATDPFGEAISYSPDGKTFLTVSDTGALDGVKTEILRYAQAQVTPTAPGAEPAKSKASSVSWMDQLSLQDITYLIGAVGVLGALMVGAGIFGIVRARRRPPDESGSMRGDEDGGRRSGRAGIDDPAGDLFVPAAAGGYAGYDEPGWDYPAGGGYGNDLHGAEPVGQGQRPSGGGVYGGKPSGGVYGGGSSGVYGGGASSGAVHGGKPSGGGVYGAAEYRSGARPDDYDDGNRHTGNGYSSNGYADHGGSVYGYGGGDQGSYPGDGYGYGEPNR